MVRRSIKATAALGAAVCAAALVTGCAPTPTPVVAPSPVATGFASDEEAFAAAEATYRAYIDALNQVSLADPSTFQPVLEVTTGAAQSTINKELTDMYSKGWTVGGQTVVTVAEPDHLSSDGIATLNVCADVSAVSLVDADGNSMIATDRPRVQPLAIEVSTARRISRVMSISGRSGQPEC